MSAVSKAGAYLIFPFLDMQIILLINHAATARVINPLLSSCQALSSPVFACNYSFLTSRTPRRNVRNRHCTRHRQPQRGAPQAHRLLEENPPSRS